MSRWFIAVVTGMFLAGSAFSQDETNLVLKVDSLSGKEVSGTWPYIAGVGVNFAAKSLDTADIISAQVKLVGVAPTTGSVQAMMYIKTGSDYVMFDEGVYTDLTSGTWVEVKSLVKNMVADSLTRVLELGIKLTTSAEAVYTGQIKIDDVVIKRAGGNVEKLADFSEGLLGWREIQFGDLGRVIKEIAVPGERSAGRFWAGSASSTVRRAAANSPMRNQFQCSSRWPTAR